MVEAVVMDVLMPEDDFVELPGSALRLLVEAFSDDEAVVEKPKEV
jgi:hypothetical protein